MKNTTVMIVGTGLVAAVTGLALYAGRDTTPPAPGPKMAEAPTGMGAGPNAAGVPQVFPPPNTHPNTPATATGAMPMDGGIVITRPPADHPTLQVMGATPTAVPGTKDLTPEGMSSALESVLKGLGTCLETARTDAGKLVKAELSFEAWAGDGKWTIRKPEVKTLSPDSPALRTCLLDQMRSVTGDTTQIGAMRFVVPIEYGLPAVLGPPPMTPPQGLAQGAQNIPPPANRPGVPQGMPPGMQGMPPGMQGMPPGGMQGMPPGMQGMPPAGMQGMPPQGMQAAPPQGAPGAAPAPAPVPAPAPAAAPPQAR